MMKEHSAVQDMPMRMEPDTCVRKEIENVKEELWMQGRRIPYESYMNHSDE
jgi:hypothetical protein